MDGLNELTGAALAWTAQGHTYRLNVLTLADYGEIENRILAARPDPLAGVGKRLAALAPRERKAELESIFDRVGQSRHVTLRDLDAWWPTHDGYAYRFWLMTRGGDDRLTFETAADVLGRLDPGERASLDRAMDRCHGWPSPWPPPERPRGKPDPRETIPWHRWALDLSRTFGWTPAQIGRLTIAQTCIYLGRSCPSAPRQTVPLDEGLAICRQRRDDRDRWIRAKLEEFDHDR